MERYHLKLIKGISFTNGDISAHKDNPDVYVDGKEAAEAAVSTGYFAYADDENAPVAPAKQEPKRLELMNVAELETYAVYHDIDIKGVKGKQNIIKAIIEAQGDEVKEKGSPTMQVLQEQK